MKKNETENKKRPEEKLELAEKIARQSQKITARYDMVGDALKRAFRWFSAWFYRIVFNPKYARIVAFGFAILVYLTFSTERVDTVVQAKSLSNVKVNAIYNREMYEVEGIEDTVEVDIIGDYSEIIVVEPEEITAELDLRMLGEGTHQVDYAPVGVSSRVKATVVPASSRITIRIKETKTMSLSYEFINQDKLGDQYVLGEVVMDTRDVTISASKETLDDIVLTNGFGYVDLSKEYTVLKYICETDKYNAILEEAKIKDKFFDYILLEYGINVSNFSNSNEIVNFIVENLFQSEFIKKCIDKSIRPFNVEISIQIKLLIVFSYWKIGLVMIFIKISLLYIQRRYLKSI